jgi:hypothetical protein
MFGESFIRMRIKLTGMSPEQSQLELLRVECLEPRAKTRKLVRGKLLDAWHLHARMRRHRALKTIVWYGW